jgi:Ca2+/Na+ antiporter
MLGILGNIINPNTTYQGQNGEGLFLFLSNIFKLAGVIAGIVLIIRLITAGYSYLSAQGDPKKFQAAGDTITQSILGLVIVAAAFVIAGLVGRLTGIDILNPVIYGPQ